MWVIQARLLLYAISPCMLYELYHTIRSRDLIRPLLAVSEYKTDWYIIGSSHEWVWYNVILMCVCVLNPVRIARHTRHIMHTNTYKKEHDIWVPAFAKCIIPSLEIVGRHPIKYASGAFYRVDLIDVTIYPHCSRVNAMLLSSRVLDWRRRWRPSQWTTANEWPTPPLASMRATVTHASRCNTLYRLGVWSDFPVTANTIDRAVSLHNRSTICTFIYDVR